MGAMILPSVGLLLNITLVILFFSKEYQYDWKQGKVCYYNNGNKINIDCGAFWYGFTILLDLDTFEEHIIGEVAYP